MKNSSKIGYCPTNQRRLNCILEASRNDSSSDTAKAIVWAKIISGLRNVSSLFGGVGSAAPTFFSLFKVGAALLSSDCVFVFDSAILVRLLPAVGGVAYFSGTILLRHFHKIKYSNSLSASQIIYAHSSPRFVVTKFI